MHMLNLSQVHSCSRMGISQLGLELRYIRVCYRLSCHQPKVSRWRSARDDPPSQRPFLSWSLTAGPRERRYLINLLHPNRFSESHPITLPPAQPRVLPQRPSSLLVSQHHCDSHRLCLFSVSPGFSDFFTSSKLLTASSGYLHSWRIWLGHALPTSSSLFPRPPRHCPTPPGSPSPSVFVFFLSPAPRLCLK